MGKCPYCNAELHLGNFFTQAGTLLGMPLRKFEGETMKIGYKNAVKMFTCPKCDKILGFSEYRWDDD